MAKPTALHKHCVACLSVAEGVKADDQTVVLLGMIASGSQPIGAILLDLCGVHREQTAEAVEDLRAAWNAGTP